MISVAILDNKEPKVIELTWDNLHRELSPIVGSELFIVRNIHEAEKRANNSYVSIVEADCLVNSGYFSSLLGLYKKNNHFRKLAMLSSAVGRNTWHDRFFGYNLDLRWSEPTRDKLKIKTSSQVIVPITEKRSNEPYPVQVGYLPGALIRKNALHHACEEITYFKPNLDDASQQLSMYFWHTGRRVYINPNTTYVTTEPYGVNERNTKVSAPQDVVNLFQSEGIE